MNKRHDFIKNLGLNLDAAQIDILAAYGDLIFEKKDFLNLTSVSGKQEIWDRHICDGFVAAALFDKAARGKEVQIADYGAGAGYIGIAIAAALPYAKITLVEALEKRCKFMDWAVLKLGLKNIEVLNARAGQKAAGNTFDFTTERAMGKIEDIIAFCAADLKTGGLFAAYQAIDSACPQEVSAAAGLAEESSFEYTLPGEDKKRKLAIFRKL